MQEIAQEYVSQGVEDTVAFVCPPGHPRNVLAMLGAAQVDDIQAIKLISLVAIGRQTNGQSQVVFRIDRELIRGDRPHFDLISDHAINAQIALWNQRPIGGGFRRSGIDDATGVGNFHCQKVAVTGRQWSLDRKSVV